MEKSLYIQPNMSRYKNFKEVIEAKSLYPYGFFTEENKISINDLLSFQRTFIIAEPGYGKTRLLKEIIRHSSNAIFLDLKKVDREIRIETFIHEKQNIAHKISDLNLDEEKFHNSTFIKTDDFKLNNTEETIVCLDALDEVGLQDFSKIVDRIKEFSHQYPNINLIVSCRWHFFNKHQKLFVDTKFQYIQISALNLNQVKKYLKNYTVSEEDIESIIHALYVRNGKLIILVPRYLEIIASLIKEKGVEYTKKLKKTELLDNFIYKKLEKEDKTLNTQKKEIIKRVLEKLALIMEIYQNNLLSKDELITFFDDIKTNLINILQEGTLESFYNNSLLKDNIDTIEFENTEFQEYLAAKEIKRLERTNQTVFNLAVDPKIKEIYPSWFNTLEFLVDLDKSLLKPLLDFGSSQSQVVQFEGFHRLLTRTNTDCLSIKEKKAIFSQVFIYYQNILHWIDFEIAENLSYYFDSSFEYLLKDSVDCRKLKRGSSDIYIRRANVAEIIDYLLERNILNTQQKRYWRKKLIGFAKDKNKNGVMQRRAIYALRHFKDISIYQNIFPDLKKDDNSIYEAFIKSCMMANPNDRFSIERFVEGSKLENINIHVTSISSIFEIKEKQAIKLLLNVFIDDSVFLLKFLKDEEIFKDKYDQLIKNIQNVFDNEIMELLCKFIKVAMAPDNYYYANKSMFIKDIALLLKDKDISYIFNLISELSLDDDLKTFLYGFQYIFATILEKQQVETFIRELEQFERGRNIALLTLQQIKYSVRIDAEEIYEEGRKYLKAQYESFENRGSEQNKPLRSFSIYKDFQLKLEPQNGMFSGDVFRFYNNNQEIIDSRITYEERERLGNLLIEEYLAKDPLKSTLNITQKNKNGTTYTASQYIHIIHDCLKTICKLELDLPSQYRKNIINFIPFAYLEDIEVIFKLVPNPKDSELKKMIDVYRLGRTDDLEIHRPESFIEASEKYELREAIPVLKKFVEQSNLSIYDRVSALKAIAHFQSDEEYLIGIFEKYSDNKETETYQLTEKSNEFLIEKYSNKIAINWRFEQLSTKAFTFVELREGQTHLVGGQEEELHGKGFAHPIMNLKKPEYKEHFVNLLSESFNFLKKDYRYWSYSSYLWDIVINYFENLKELRSYSYLRNLEQFVQNHAPVEGINWFKDRLLRLKHSYITYIGKPQNIGECIKKCNHSAYFIELHKT